MRATELGLRNLRRLSDMLVTIAARRARRALRRL